MSGNEADSDDSRNISSRGASKYKSKEVDMSESSRPLRAESNLASTKDWENTKFREDKSKRSPFTPSNQQDQRPSDLKRRKWPVNDSPNP